MKVNKKILLIGVLLGIITIFFLNRYIQSLRVEPEEAAATSYSDVVTAITAIPEHIRITEEMVQISSLPAEGIHPDAVTELDLVVGAITRTEIISGEQILSGRIVNEESDAGLSYWLPENMRAISIPLSTISGVSNFIQKGDKVDILVTYETNLEETEPPVEGDRVGSTTFTQFQNMEVLELGSRNAPTAEESYEQPGSITLLATPEEAEILAWVTLNGSIHMTLRNPVDNQINELEHYGMDNFETFRVR
ncbi:Flp pilus assembly protein CpaB [Gudongella sp. DL1XJH-153]|uniref:Flp pilus assembly protein CpaB n=1 Tax=Gudongella sp. DL1XJH-153 TaxID=3409804 RepID=UPI003BB6C50A